MNIKRDDDKHAYQQIQHYDNLQADKKVLEDWIEFHHLYNGPDTRIKGYRLRKRFKEMQNELEDMMYKFWEEVDEL